MNRTCMHAIAASILIILVSLTGFAQQDAKKNWYAASLDGTSGLFKAWEAETLKAGETNFTFGYDLVNRDPGQMKVGRATAGAAVGITDRFEFFASMDVQRHITADNIGYYQLGQHPLPTITPAGDQYFSQVAPFMDVPVSTGRSDIRLGLKLNFASERKGAPLSAAVSGFGTIPGQTSPFGLRRGLSTGAYQGGFAFLMSKTASDVARLHMNVGSNFYGEPNGSDVNLQNEIIYRGGAEFMPHKPVRLIAELSGLKYYGDGTPGLNPVSPLDVIVGLRAFPTEWMSIGAGYQLSLRHVKDDFESESVGGGVHGFVVQGTFGSRRDRPPTVECAVARSTILQGDTTTIRAHATDPDGDDLFYTWTASGGKVTGDGSTGTFDATGVAPGKYTVTATVQDRRHSVSCSNEITVLRRSVTPQVSVEPSTFSILPGESVALNCSVANVEPQYLKYAWTVNGQKIAADTARITFGSEGRAVGSYEVACTATDDDKSATAVSKGAIRERPNKPPVVECLTSTIDIASGKSVELQVKATDPDGDKLTYSWSGPGNAVKGTAATAVFNAAGIRAGSYIVTAAVDDGRGGKASCSITVNVSETISVTKDKCGYFTSRGVRLDNCAKAVLDDLAVRMKNEPRLRANIIGYTDGSDSEKASKGLGERRAKAAADYLSQQGIESARMTITDGAVNNPVGDNKTAAGRQLNRRVEIELSIR